MTLIRNTILIYGVGFVLFMGLHLIFSAGNRPPAPTPLNSPYVLDINSGQRNIISKKSSGNRTATTVDQKYEQVASVSTVTKEFEADERNARARIEAVQALIQFEQRTGLPGQRTLRLAIGVSPANFDTLVTDLRALGRLTRFQSDKTDKTNEYLDLQAQKISLEKSRDGLLALKARDGKIDEMINLEGRILELERQIQALGVSLGDFDAENEFSTVKLFLAEAVAPSAQGTIWNKVFKALIWTLKYYTLVWVGLAALLFAMFIALKLLAMILGGVRLIERAVDK